MSGEPPVFLRLSTSEIPDLTLTQDTTETGDDCHFLMNGVKKSYYRTIVKQKEIGDYEICCEQGPRSLTIDDILKQR